MTTREYLPSPAGCPTDSSIMAPLRAVGSAKLLQADFDAFKFPGSQLVQFRWGGRMWLADGEDERVMSRLLRVTAQGPGDPLYSSL